MVALIPTYVAVVVLTGLTIVRAALLAKRTGERVHQVFLVLVVVNNLACLEEVLLKLFPAWLARPTPEGPALLAGFIAFPLMAAFSYLVIDWMMGLSGLRVPAGLTRGLAAFWGLLFLGFLVAEYQFIENRDMRLSRVLEPVFNWAIVASGLGAVGFAGWRGARSADAEQRRHLLTMSGWTGGCFVVFGVLFLVPLPMTPAWQVSARALLGLAYLLPPIRWMSARARAARGTPPAAPAGGLPALDAWLESGALSPRERQIVRCVVEGKTNAAIGEELFIGVRTVESHLYSIYRKLGVKNRLQLARLATLQSQRQEPD